MVIQKRLCTTCTNSQGYIVQERDIDDWGICPKCGKQGVIYTVPDHPANAPVLENRATVQFGEVTQKKAKRKSNAK